MPALVGKQTTPSENKPTKIESEKGNLSIRVVITYTVTVSLITGKGKCFMRGTREMLSVLLFVFQILADKKLDHVPQEAPWSLRNLTTRDSLPLLFPNCL